MDLSDVALSELGDLLAELLEVLFLILLKVFVAVDLELDLALVLGLDHLDVRDVLLLKVLFLGLEEVLLVLDQLLLLSEPGLLVQGVLLDQLVQQADLLVPQIQFFLGLQLVVVLEPLDLGLQLVDLVLLLVIALSGNQELVGHLHRAPLLVPPDLR